MGLDRNTVIGFVLIGLLLIGMFYFNSKDSLAFQAQQKKIADSLAALKPKPDPKTAVIDSLRKDSAVKQTAAGNFIRYMTGTANETVLENEVLRITFSNKGGQPVKAELKQFKLFNGSPLVLLNDPKGNKFSYAFNSSANTKTQTDDLYFDVAKPAAADGSQVVQFSIADSSGKKLIHEYKLRPNEYMLDLDVKLSGADKLLTNNVLDLVWQASAPQAEKDIKYERQQTHICYLANESFDFEYLGSGSEKKFEKPVSWLSLKQQFFLTGLAAKNKFQSADVSWKVPADSIPVVTALTANCRMSVANGSEVDIPMQMYFGPSDYNVLKKYDNQMHNIVPYGTGMFAFVKYINRHFLLPVWDFLRKNISSYGIIILLLTLFIRLLTSPILYKSYVSGAKMKALKPELDELKAKHGDDKQAYSMDQMKLWKSAGVSPLGGCLPALLQIPIFMSLYYFFQSNISLRGQAFLWAKDLAAYDSIATLPFNIPFYGSHVSLFTLTAVATSLLISIYSMSNMQGNDNPMMKYMPYIFPVLLLGVFNNLPSALTWYYTISNTITLILQVVIQKYIINHDKLRAQIEENKKRPVKTGWADKLQTMQETNKKVQEMKNRTNTNKKK